MRHFVLLLILLFNSNTNINAQKYDYVWVTGDDNHTFDSITGFGGSLIDFNFMPLKASPHYRKLEMFSCNASICDTAGNLLFYTNGCNIAGADDEILENGDQINPGTFHDLWCDQYQDGYNSGFHSAFILPLPGSDSVYYLFHQQDKWKNTPPTDVFTEKLLYSKVVFADTLQGTPKGVVTVKNAAIIEDTLSHGEMAAVKHANGKDWWIVVPRRNSNVFYIFKFTEQGIVDTMKQVAGGSIVPDEEYDVQVLFSPDGSKMFRSKRHNPLLIYDFDRETGLFTDFGSLDFDYGDQYVGHTGVGVSPSGQYLYLSCRNFLYQLDLWADNILSSQVTVAEYDGFTTPFPTLFYMCQLAPDCKIYTMAGGDTRYWHVIHNPDLPYPDCNVEQRGLVLPTRCGSSMPFPPNYRLGPIDNPGLPCTQLTGTSTGPALTSTYSVFPNPATDQLTVTLNRGGGGRLLLQLYDPLGRLVLSTDLVMDEVADFAKVNLWGLPAGAYAYVLSGEGGAVAKAGVLVKM